MPRNNTIRLTLTLLLCAWVCTSTLRAQTDGSADGNQVTDPDDIPSLFADDGTSIAGPQGATSLLEDLGGTQGEDPMATDSPDDPSNLDPALPVDGGLSLLLAAGAAYGVRRLKRRK